jgi:hypothetical protein
MKRLIMMSVILASSFIYKAADAQVKLNVNLNLGGQPKWAQSQYEQVNYYYMPDLDMYYNVPSRTYTYLQGNRWVTVNTIPQKYRNYDFDHGYKVVVNEKNPWNNHAKYRNNYAKNQKVKVIKVNPRNTQNPQFANKNSNMKTAYERNDRDNNRNINGTVRRGRG